MPIANSPDSAAPETSDIGARSGPRAAWRAALTLGARTPAARNRYVDFLRAGALVVVVAGHWLMAAPVVDRAELTLSDVLAVAPWTQWLTWGFQVMPLFFVVGGYANAASWSSAQRSGTGAASWLAVRLDRLVRPALPLLGVWCAAVLLGRALGVRADVVRVAGHVAMIPVWFLAVYVMVVATVPFTHYLWRRYGLVSVFGFAAGAAIIDAVAFGAGLGWLRWANHAFIWPGLHQLGYAWRDARLGGPAKTLLWSVGGLAVLALLVGVASYPVSMVTVPGEQTSNSRPPTFALLALGATHVGIALAMEQPVQRWLERVWPWALTLIVNRSIMTLYLWHTSALVLVIGVAQLLGGYGLALAPTTAAWWLSRPLWLAVVGLAMLPLLLIFAHFERSHRPPQAAPPPLWRSFVGASGFCAGLAMLSLAGLADASPLGIRAPAVLLALGGSALALAPPHGPRVRSPRAGDRPRQ